MSRRFFRHAFIMVAGTVVAQLLQVLLSPILTRLFTPAQFGEFQAVVSIAALLAVIFTLRYELAIVLAADDEEGAGVARLAMLLSLLAAGACLLVVTSALALGWHAPPALSGSMPFFMVGLALLMAFSQIGAGWANRQQAYQRLSISVIAQQGVTAVASLLLGIFKPVPHGLVFGRLIGQVSAVLTLFSPSLLVRRTEGAPSESGSYRRLARKYNKFPRFNVAYSLIASAGRDFLVLAFAAMHDMAAAGAYGLARTISYLPMTFMSAALSQVFYREAANAAPERVSQLAQQLLSAMAVAFVPGFIVLVFYGPPLFAFAFGDQWEIAGTYAAILAIPAALATACSWPERLFEVAGRQKVALMLQAGFDSVSVIVIAALVYNDYPALWAVSAYALLNACFNIAYVASAWRVSGFPPGSLLKPGRLALVAAGVAALACIVLRELPFPVHVSAILAATASIVHVGLLMYRWRTLFQLNAAEAG